MNKTEKISEKISEKIINDNVLLDIVENIIDDNILSKKTIRYNCCAAVKHTTKENSLNDLNNDLCVFLTRKNTSGKNPIYSSYVQCSKSPSQNSAFPQNGENLFCHIHAKTNPEKIIKMEDLIKDAFKATVTHEYYGDMGIRGAKGNKKPALLRDTKQPISTQNINNILESGNDILIKNLEQFAQQLIVKSIKSNKVKLPTIVDNSNNELLDFLQEKLKPIQKNEIANVQEWESENESVDNNLLQISHQKTIDEVNTESNTESNENSDDDDEDNIECIEISSINGSLFLVDEKSMDVYKIIEDEHILIGKLKEISEKYSQINHNNKKYSVFCEETNGGKSYLKCYLTNKKFDLNLKPLK